MPSPTVKSIIYAPSMVPAGVSDTDVLRRFLLEELEKISFAITQLATGHLDIAYAPPAKPRNGDFRNADGVLWDPGAGAGFYRFDGASWVFLG